jgi:serine/threonine-protein kinase HipA
LVGELTQDRGGQLGFVYSESWLSQSGAIPLSKSLPLETKKFTGQQARSFFAGILPEEGQREQIAAIFGISPQNDFALLERIGGECAGAITLLPPDISLAEGHEPTFETLDDIELSRIIADLPRRPLMAGRGGLRLSLAGAQPKLPVFLNNGKICLPLGESASTHIIKPEPAHFQGLAYVEALCMALAKEVGLSVANVEVIKIGEIDCLLIERYDRIVTAANTVTRVHQEDFCQALGFPPERKYQQEGGPLLRDCIRLIREWATIPALDLRNFIDGSFSILS